MCYQDIVKIIIFSPLSKERRKILVKKALEEFYGKLEIPSEVINLEKKRCANGGLVDQLPEWVH